VLIFNFSVILASIKCIFSINFNNYGTYYFPLVFLVFLIFIVNYLSKILKITQKYKLKNYKTVILLILLFIFSSYTFSNIERRNLTFTNKISTEKGTIYVEEEFAQSIFDSLNYIKNNTKKDDVILTLPEGAMINFLSDRQSNNKYFYLIPPNIEVFNEDKIVEDLTKNLPKYIVIQPMSYKNFKETYFCESFGNKICNLIPQYYNPPIVFGKNFWIAIYERKN
jgi:Ca2+/Na+ antiporter